MRIRKIGILAATTVLFHATASFADAVALFPLEVVNTPQETAKAIVLTMSQQIESRGFAVVSGESLPIAVATPPTVDASGNETAIPPNSAPETAASDTASGPLDATGPAAAEPGPLPTHDAATPESRSMASLGAGCRFYITGSLVQLGQQLTITLDLFLADGTRIAGKKIVSPDERNLPGAIQTISFSVTDEMLRYRESPVKATETETAPPKPVASENNFQKNFGLMLGQTFSLSDDMYSFMTFYFNGRFEFNRLLMTTNAGFALGNKDPENGFHFALNISLSAYLLKTQVTPYLGGGFGFFIGNRMNYCTAMDEYSYDYQTCEENGLVGWDVFPVLGLEILRTMFMRVHLEGRYLVTFNGYGSWGHGPAVMMGIAF